MFWEMTLEVDEFIRRFLLHVLPDGFFKVRSGKASATTKCPIALHAEKEGCILQE